MNKVIAKMVCTKMEDLVSQNEKRFIFRAVYEGSEENKSFSRWTPSADLTMIVSNETLAGDLFLEGEEYYLTFDKAGKDPCTGN